MKITSNNNKITLKIEIQHHNLIRIDVQRMNTGDIEHSRKIGFVYGFVLRNR